MVFDVTVEGKTLRLELENAGAVWKCRLDGKEIEVDVVMTRAGVLSLLKDGRSYEIRREQTPTGTNIWVGGRSFATDVTDPRSLRSRRDAAADAHGARKLIAPMPGKVVRVLATEKSEVEAGQGVVVVEAMKMQNEIKSPKKGIVQKILVAEGAAVNAGDALAIVE
jgi:biotin carboxyl carrier protein